MFKVEMIATDKKNGLGKQIFVVRFGKITAEVSNDFKKFWTFDELLEGHWSGEWCINRIWYRGCELNFHTSSLGLALIRDEYRNYKKENKRKVK